MTRCYKDEFPKSVKLAAFQRCKGHCECGCGGDIQALRAQFSYSPSTGAFERTAKRSGPNPQSRTGSRNGGGYLRLRFFSKKHYVHVLAWAHYHGRWSRLSIDHIDGDTSNNKIENLREATHQQNCCNRRRRVNNLSGVKGVCWDRQHNKYRVQITANGRRVFQALASTLDEAADIYEKHSAIHHGAFSRPDR